MKNNPLIKTLLNLRGNSRACVYTEPLWGIPFSLYSPFVSVYMAALFLTDKQIGLVASISMLFKALSALLSGALTDKFGRKITTLISDSIAFSIPCLLWAFSRNVWWFMLAAALNGVMMVSENSWTCLLVEDADKKQMVKIYSLIHMTGQLAVVFAPLAGLLVSNLTIVPAMRIIYLFSFFSMTAKFILLYKYCDETQTGIVRKAETSGMSLFKIMRGYGRIFKKVMASPGMVLALTMSAVFNITGMISGNFFGLFISGSLLIPQQFLAYFPILRSLIIAVFLFGVQSKLSRFGYRFPMLIGVFIYIVSLAALILSPKESLVMPLVCVFLEACAHGLVMPRKDSAVAILIEPDERARIYATMNFIVLGCGIPFGYLAGWLSDMDRRFPFLLGIALYVLVFTVIAACKKLLAHKDMAS